MRYIVALFALWSAVAIAEDRQSELYEKLHAASSDINYHVDVKVIAESLYRQMRPRAFITREDLSSSQIDQRVKTYISKKYAPTLIDNYSRLYSKMRKAGKDFSRCDEFTAFPFSEDVKMTLCVTEEPDEITVKYMTNGYNRGWSLASAFIFRKGSKFTLVAIDLGLRGEQRVRVEGI